MLKTQIPVSISSVVGNKGKIMHITAKPSANGSKIFQVTHKIQHTFIQFYICSIIHKNANMTKAIQQCRVRIQPFDKWTPENHASVKSFDLVVYVDQIYHKIIKFPLCAILTKSLCYFKFNIQNPIHGFIIWKRSRHYYCLRAFSLQRQHFLFALNFYQKSF